MKKEIKFTIKEMEAAFEAGCDFAMDNTNNPDNAEYMFEQIALKQGSNVKECSCNCNITVEIGNINVDSNYYSFDYKVIRNNKTIKEGSYENDHAWEDLDAFENLLKNSMAVEIAMIQAF